MILFEQKGEVMHYLDGYKHLNKEDKFKVEMDLEWVVRKVMAMNYGMHRFLSAFVRFQLLERPENELAKGILALLEKGYF